MNWRLATTHYQYCYPSSLLNLPDGAVITSIQFGYNTRGGDLGTGGELKVRLGEMETNSYNGTVADTSKLSLCYKGEHKIQPLTSDKVSYSFSEGYAYQGEGKTLVVDITNEDNPRVGFSSDATCMLQYSSSITEGWTYDYMQSRKIEGVPDITITYTYDGDAAILYIPFTERLCNVGVVPVEAASKTLTIPVINEGSSSLTIDAYQSDVVTTEALTVDPGQTAYLSVFVSPRSVCSFFEMVRLQSNGGVASFQILGTSYQMPQAETSVTLDAYTRLQDQVTDNTIQELSISGSMTLDDWRYLSDNFSQLIYLDMSQAIWPDENFGISYTSYGFENTLQRLSLPSNITSVYSSVFSKCTKLRQLVLPVGLEYFNVDLSGCLLLNSLVSLAPTPPYLSTSNVKTVNVPQGCISAYQANGSYWNMAIEEIDEAALKGEVKPIKQLDIKGAQHSMGQVMMNYQQTEVHSRLFIPASLLNLPYGSTIEALSFDYYVNNYDNISCDPGWIKIAVAFADSKEDALAQTSFTPFYDESDLIDVSKTEQIQTITYSSSNPLAYTGHGIVVDIISSRNTAVEGRLWIDNAVNELEDYGFWHYEPNEVQEWPVKPDLSIHFSTESTDPILFVSADDHKQIVGYAPVHGSSVVKQIPVQNLGATDLVVTGMTGASSFVMVPSTVTIPAYSTGLIGFSFQPTQSGNVKERGCLQSNGGQSYIQLVGFTLRQAPYWHDVPVSSNCSLEQYIYEHQLRNDTITALSVSGALTSSDWNFIRHNLPALKYLDLSTATIPSHFNSSNFVNPSNLEKLALPLEVQERIDFSGFVNLNYLIYPMTTTRVFMDAFRNCPNLTSLIVLSSTPPQTAWTSSGSWGNNITKVYVPEEAVEAYAREQGWQYNSGYDDPREILPITDEVLGGAVEAESNRIVITGDRVYNMQSYPGSMKSIWISPKESDRTVDYQEVPTASLVIEGGTPIHIDTLGLVYPLTHREYEGTDRSSYGSLLNLSSDLTVENLSLDLKIKEGYVWYFLSVPFPVTLNDIQTNEDSYASFVIRTYNGQNRALYGVDQTGSGMNWDNLNSTDYLVPGRGYIFQSNAPIETLRFSWNRERQLMDPTQFVQECSQTKQVSVQQFNSENAADKNWNLIGNPYLAFYDIRKMNYTAPIIIRDGYYDYMALSPIDDAYALRPLEAFFVQVPDQTESIEFSQTGQSLVPYVPETRSALRASMNRQVFNLRLTQEGKSDRSRVVLNPDAKGDYEVARDAAKWMSEEVSSPQLYTLDNKGTKYAINELPTTTGIVPLGIRVGTDGLMTLALTGDPGSLRLYDKELKREVDLSEGDYTFMARKGTIENRFELRFSSATANEPVTAESVRVYANASQLVVEAPEQMAVSVYSTAGVLLHQTTMTATRWNCPLSAGIYVVRVGDTNHKVIIY
ncbi:MAG: leucine-rich repeat protein [bacterium]|nr:leucine-rich repeat protein [bacterium]